MTSNLDVSIIIVNWNTREVTCECLRSIYRHTSGIDFELIVVDNGSSDDSTAIIRKRYPHVVLIENTENLGFATANNQGIKIAKGTYVCLVNSDIMVLENSLSAMVQYMNAHSEVGMLGPKLLWRDHTLQGSCRKFPSLWNTLCPAIGLTYLFPKTSFFGGEHMVGYFNHDQIIDVDAFVGAFMFVRHSALECIGVMDESYFMYSEEIDWCRRFKLAGWKIRFFPNTQVIHLGRGSSSIEPIRFCREYCLSSLRYWKKFHSSPTVLAYRLLMLFRYAIRLPLWWGVFLFRKNEASKAKISIALTGLEIFSGILKRS
jgi:GT2 family glycosyltransferase